MIINHKEFLKLLPSLHNICKITGELQIKYHKTNIKYSTKPNSTPVTQVDMESSLIITDGLKKLTPEIVERAAVLANLKKQIATAKVNAQRAATIKAQEKIEANK